LGLGQLRLIVVVGVKLFLMASALPAGHSLRFAVGAWPLGVRRARSYSMRAPDSIQAVVPGLRRKAMRRAW
jgi:hypothetical protein